MAADSANAQRRRACLVFFDETALSLTPNVRRSWAPVGHPPVLQHRFNWKKASMAAALCYGVRGGGAQLCFHLQPGNHNTDSLIQVLGELQRFLGGEKATLLWDGLPAHRSRAMQAWLATQRHWLVVERLPAYAPELNPVEGLWSWLKGSQLANLACPTLQAVVEQAELGIERARRMPHLASRSFAGLAYWSHDRSDQDLKPVEALGSRRRWSAPYSPTERSRWGGMMAVETTGGAIGLDEQILEPLRAGLRGDVIRPGDTQYDDARAIYNATIDKRPVIARCVDAGDVIAAVNVGRDSGLEVAVMGGGHSGPGLCLADDGLTIDLSPMRWVRVDPEARTAQVGGGSQIGDLDHAAHASTWGCRRESTRRRGWAA